jgi:cyclophilin family peptidyl-prolyl cis-trans isomerase
MKQIPTFVLFALAAALAAPSSAVPAGQAYPDGVYAEVTTNKGLIVLRLEHEKTPLAAMSFVGLAEGTIRNEALPPGTPYFDGSKWHRVVAGHVIQCGQPGGGGKAQGPGYQIPNEIAPGLSHDHAGAVGLANSGPHTGGSQWYITLADRSYLDGNLTVFGEVVRGMDVVKTIAQGDDIQTIRIVRVGAKAEAFRPTTEAFLPMIQAAKERVSAEEKVRLEKEEALIAARWPEAVAGEKGVRAVVLLQGTGPAPVAGDKIRVRYNGTTLLENLAFVSTADGTPYRGSSAEAFEVEVGKTRLFPALDAVLAAMKQGEKRRLIVPWEQGFGRNGYYAKAREGEKRFLIPPFARLVVEVEILDSP